MSAEWIEFGGNWGSFREQGLNRPGTQLDVQNCFDLTKHKLYLIGDINKLGGICDDCVGISSRATIIRYRILETNDD